MVAPATVSTPQRQASANHQYGTRIRSNSIIKPSIRLRHSAASAASTPRRIKPAPTPKSKNGPITFGVPQPDYPPFPPDHVMLHHDDADSKVFMAIGRSFMSVDNRAMTIKDLAEMTMQYGIMCQNVSAAGQAITTYIRNHLQRCEVQQDHPLLLRHVLSGTASDDDLLPALHSRMGGAHCALNPSESRITNFRRGTMVWYLSRAAGAPCPFARCGIRLCEYTENGKVGDVPTYGREKKRERDRLRRAEHCGQKRKRLLRSAYADKGSDSDSMSEEEKRPPKVKLTLRLRPLNASSSGASLSASPAPQDEVHVCQSQPHSPPEIIDLSKDDSDCESSGSEEDSDDDDSMSVDSSLSSDADEDVPPASAFGGDSLSPSTYGAHSTFSSASPDVYRRSTSASPPPDTEDEEDDYHHSMTNSRRYSLDRYSSWDDEDEDEMNLDDNFWDMDNDAETQWESPGPRSPSAQFEDVIFVKQEPSDVGGMLDAWDDLDARGDPKVVDVVLRAAAGLDTDFVKPKLEEIDSWELPHFAGTSSDSFVTNPIDDATSHIKEEEVESGVPFLTRGLHTPSPERASLSPSPISPISPSALPPSFVAERRDSHLIWRDAELLGPDSLKPHDLAEGDWREGRRSSDIPSPAAEQPQPSSVASTSASGGDALQGQQARVGPPPPRLDLASSGTREQGYLVPDLSSPSLLSSLTSLTIHTPTSPEALKGTSPTSPPPHGPGLAAQHASLRPAQDEEPQIIQTSQPCDPPIAATQLEGVSVYQMTLQSSLILRRLDTGFVLVDPLLKELGLPSSSSPFPNAICIAKGSAQVCGTWLPLTAARDLCKDHPVVALFLSDQLPDRFPATLQELTRHAHPFSRWPGSFGQHFKSTIEAKRQSLSSHRLVFPAEDQDMSQWASEENFLSMQSALALSHAILPTLTTSPEEHMAPELPLSPAEEKMFRELCSDPEWEASTPPSESAALERSEAAVEAPPAEASATAKGKEPPCQDRPLRRSKRVADAIAMANRSRTRSSKRGSRSSLS
ncbi:uncharacterized protein B0H18DRAFT_872618 [Fomitopsis serialis]|uniref:uncharacterized protein n=1 Tax=Fomitopsis serialis TaxID=139415 RepID=UPI002008E814|nr:uncharacterized protein B0H18DRAFT_872618 [Neoantrodia serialis]KAH9930982.1 hypothetical protein B0H18DRAFT_872618 [Neoantrodia serialis]